MVREVFNKDKPSRSVIKLGDSIAGLGAAGMDTGATEQKQNSRKYTSISKHVQLQMQSVAITRKLHLIGHGFNFIVFCTKLLFVKDSLSNQFKY